MANNDYLIHTQGGKLIGDTSRSDVSRIISKALTHTGTGGIAFHFHGGLVNKASGVEIADRLIPEYSAAHAYPIFTVWETGVIETLRNNWFSIASEPFFEKVRARLIKMVMRKMAQTPGERTAQSLPAVDAQQELEAVKEAAANPDILLDTGPQVPNSLTELTRYEEIQLEQELLMDPDLLSEVEKVSAGLMTPAEIEAQRASRSATVRASVNSLIDPDAVEAYIERPEAGARGIISSAKLIKAVVVIVAKIVHRFITKRDHGFHATVVEELLRAFYVGNAGRFVWNSMKNDAFDHFGGDGSSFAGTAILEELVAGWDGDSPPRITLIGHSAGSVFISAFIEAADAVLEPGFKFDVIFLAPAARYDLTSKTLADMGHRIANLRTFTMTDENERQDPLVDKLPWFYPSSLLYLISGVLEDEADTPITGMQRFHEESRFPSAKFPELVPLRNHLNSRTYWSVTNMGDGRSTAALDHGAFDSDTPTINSIKHLLQHGF